MKALFGSRPGLARVRRASFIEGMRMVAPLILATGTWGLVTGVAMIKVGLTTAQAIGMSLLVYSGSAQLASLPLIAAAAPIWVLFLTASVVNLRFVIFSAGLHPFFRRHSLSRRLLLAYVTIDFSFAVFLSRYADLPRKERGSTDQVWFFLGMATGSWIPWQIASISGYRSAQKKAAAPSKRPDDKLKKAINFWAEKRRSARSPVKTGAINPAIANLRLFQVTGSPCRDVHDLSRNGR